MEIKDLAEYINDRLQEKSIANARFKEGFFVDSVIVDHDESKTWLDQTIVITKTGNWWNLKYKEDDDTFIYTEIAETEGREDIDWIVEFVNNHTLIQSDEGTIEDGVEEKEDTSEDEIAEESQSEENKESEEPIMAKRGIFIDRTKFNKKTRKK